MGNRIKLLGKRFELCRRKGEGKREEGKKGNGMRWEGKGEKKEKGRAVKEKRIGRETSKSS